MDITTRNIEQCDAVSVLNAIIDMHDHPQDIMAIKQMAQSVLAKIGTPASGQPTDLFAAIAAGGGGGGSTAEIKAMLQQLIDAHVIQNVSIDGYVFTEGFTPSGLGDIVAQGDKLIEIHDPNVTEITLINSYRYYSALKVLDMPNLEGVYNENFCTGIVPLASVNLPKLKTVTSQSFLRQTGLVEIDLPMLESAYSYFLYACSNLKIVKIPKIRATLQGTAFQNCYNLIHLEFGAELYENFSITGWNPTNALNANISTLVDEGEPFANNKEKLLYNIRTYIASNLRSDVGNRTITFNANIKAAIQADADTLAAFPSNWTIA